MTLKSRIVVTVVWTVVTFGIGLSAAWYVHRYPAAGLSAEARSEQIGELTGMAGTFGYAVRHREEIS